MKLSTAIPIFATCFASIIGSEKAAAALPSIDSAASRELKQIGAKAAKASAAASVRYAAQEILDNMDCKIIPAYGLCYKLDDHTIESLTQRAGTGIVSDRMERIGFRFGICNTVGECGIPDDTTPAPAMGVPYAAGEL